MWPRQQPEQWGSNHALLSGSLLLTLPQIEFKQAQGNFRLLDEAVKRFIQGGDVMDDRKSELALQDRLERKPKVIVWVGNQSGSL
jgi:hypothetical protein